MTVKTVLQYVQGALNVMSSDSVTTIANGPNGTLEGASVAKLLADIYDELVNREEWPWLDGAMRPTQAALTAEPTKLLLADSIKELRVLSYNVDETGLAPNLRELTWQEPADFLRANSAGNTTTGKFISLANGIGFWVRKDAMPTYWTSFDDQAIYANSFKSSVETYLVTAKVFGFGTINPVFTLSDGFVPLLPEHMVPLLQNTLNAAAMRHFKQSVSQPDERSRTQQTSQARRKRSVTGQHGHPHTINNFGRNR
ncbi:MAG: hypothetical protein M0P95_17780 [Sulfuritalea sp.]|jgi:hypothetical protein|nr:hypothetical protein [Sulfuritalea sp.]